MNTYAPRVAFFTDSYHEANGIATTSRKLAEFARQRNYPMLIVACGDKKRFVTNGSLSHVELSRSRATIAVEHDFGFDPLLWRERNFVRRVLREFQPNLIHITSPGDIGLLGFYLSRSTPIPFVASWHTNLHEFASRRLVRLMPRFSRDRIEKWTIRALETIYRRARVTLAPNPDLVTWLKTHTGKPCLLMERGVDSQLFHPSRRTVTSDVFSLGFVGRLSAEKNVRLLIEIERQLLDSGQKNFRFIIVGNGKELNHLRANMKTGEFRGVLREEALARAYADMDVLVFPSETDTFGNVVLEAMASGVVPIVSCKGGPRFLIRHDVDGLIANSEGDFVRLIERLMNDRDGLKRMRLNARRRSVKSSWDEVLEVVYDGYRLALYGADQPSNRESV